MLSVVTVCWVGAKSKPTWNCSPVYEMSFFYFVCFLKMLYAYFGKSSTSAFCDVIYTEPCHCCILSWLLLECVLFGGIFEFGCCIQYHRLICNLFVCAKRMNLQLFTDLSNYNEYTQVHVLVDCEGMWSMCIVAVCFLSLVVQYCWILLPWTAILEICMGITAIDTADGLLVLLSPKSW